MRLLLPNVTNITENVYDFISMRRATVCVCAHARVRVHVCVFITLQDTKMQFERNESLSIQLKFKETRMHVA